ncbi:MAG TPA: polysaccharide deacetylase family protein [Clostridia bacterium]|nr:polysaccharide deacetylase family protein [Clostridia bacterium]
MKSIKTCVLAILILCFLSACSPSNTSKSFVSSLFSRSESSQINEKENKKSFVDEITGNSDKITKSSQKLTAKDTSDSQAPNDDSPPSQNKTTKGEPFINAKTYTGYKPLPERILNVEDPNNIKQLSNTEIRFSFGNAKNGEPSEQSKQNQDFFDLKGYNAIVYDNKSTDKVLYLTFDCGWENGYTSKVLDVLKDKKVPAAFFCTLDQIKGETELTARMIKEGHIVGNHSTKHPNFSQISRTRMAAEIQTCDNYLRQNFGYSSALFRFPQGYYSENSLDLVESVGYKSVFWSIAYDDWDVNLIRGAQYAHDKVVSRLHPGAIILLHSVSPDNSQALGDIIDTAREQGYEFKSLDG